MCTKYQIHRFRLENSTYMLFLEPNPIKIRSRCWWKICAIAVLSSIRKISASINARPAVIYSCPLLYFKDLQYAGRGALYNPPEARVTILSLLPFWDHAILWYENNRKANA